mmetsp:Transcript_120174/g.285545  ORF Transcript_120174/g.285545 Transcript_120174/m.285545 type:complete len:413 (-) Transcript_120174:149-1387(-)|eukprot:CAMPEP_0181430336 /NCGR_PEP_ID=MMETSP1110-20121109/17667_1 /TAXON_ID=174948 /ORGANISM="Symbiodinium sp., Strain CCMP421" /LENGTH=412 /DNA_ID=CAMNT_0023553641 /DNA_START=69 /DNA_END=1307 /DNA_ORIENTATION=-
MKPKAMPLASALLICLAASTQLGSAAKQRRESSESQVLRAFQLEQLALSMPEAEERALQAMRLAASRATSSSSQNDADVLGATAALLSMAARNTTQNDTKKEFVDDMQNLIDEMQEHIHNSLLPHKEYLDKIYGYFADCSNTLAQQTAAADLQNNSVTSTHSAHKLCRSQQAKDVQDVSACQAAASGSAKEGDCSGWPALQATKVADAGATCLDKSSGETYEQYLNRMKLHWDEQLSQYEKMKARCEVNSTQEPCSSEIAKLGLKKLECDGLQKTFERMFCDREKQVNRAGSNYLECYRIANETYAQASKSSRDLLASKKLDLYASHRIECLLNVFSKTHDAQKALEECKEMDHSDAIAKLTMAIKEAPGPETLPSSPPLPGDSEFFKEQYSDVLNASSQMLTCQLPFAVGR